MLALHINFSAADLFRSRRQWLSIVMNLPLILAFIISESASERERDVKWVIERIEPIINAQKSNRKPAINRGAPELPTIVLYPQA